MRIGYENAIIEDQLVASASKTLSYPISNVILDGMDTKYKSLASGDLLISMSESTGLPVDWGTSKRVTDIGTVSGDAFGTSVSVEGDGGYYVVGAPSHGAGGAIYVYRRIAVGEWSSGIEIIPSDNESGDQFGLSVAISGDYIVVGAPGRVDGGFAIGTAYVFHRTGTNTWDDGVTLEPSSLTVGWDYGRSVAINGDYAVVSSPSADVEEVSNTGSLIVFHRTGTNSWDTGSPKNAYDSEAGDKFGWSVAIYGDYLIAGVYLRDFNQGLVYIFHRTGTNTWDTGYKIRASDTVVGDNFGFDVEVFERYLIVGAPKHGALEEGAAYVFYRAGTSNWNVSETKLTVDDAVEDDHFGLTVGIYGENCIVGLTKATDVPLNTGSVYSFYRTDEETWSEGVNIAPTLSNADYFGRDGIDVSLQDIIVGAIGDDSKGAEAGAAYVYSASGGQLKITASMCVINAHNMVLGDTAVLKGYNFDTDTIPEVTYNFTFQEYGMVIIFDQGTYFWSIELNVTDPVEIGGIFLGTHLITPAYEIGASTTYITNDTYSKSKSGQLYGDEGYIGRTAKYLMPWITEDEKEDWLVFFRTVGTIKQFYLLQYPDRQDIQPVFYCHLTSKQFKLEEHEGNRSVYKDVPISIEEVF